MYSIIGFWVICLLIISVTSTASSILCVQKKCALLFALPNNNIFQDFMIQHIPKVGNSIVVFSVSVTVQSVQGGLELNFASGSSDIRSCDVILASVYSVKESGRV